MLTYYMLNSLEKMSVASICLYLDGSVVSVLHADDVDGSSISRIIVTFCTFFVAVVWKFSSS